MDEKELKLLGYLVEHCMQGNVALGDPRTYLPYSVVLNRMEFPDDGRTPGDSLNNHAMGGLAHWLHTNSFPAITGLIINKVGSGDRAGLPSFSYFNFHHRQDMDYLWHTDQIKLCCEFDWYKELELKGVVLNDTTVYPDEVIDNGYLKEGKVKTVTVNVYERSVAARNACIEAHGVSCFVCDFNFGDFYGQEASGFIHVHHLIPLSEVVKEYTVDPKNDLIPVCPNCHAMLHRRDLPKVTDLKKDIQFARICAKETTL